MEKGETMDYDPGTYDMIHQAQVQWPCLSFDVMGADAAKYPMSVYVVAGTQADKGTECQLLVMKWSQLNRTKYDMLESDDESSDDGEDDDPLLDFRMIPHDGTCNRVRCMPQAGHVVASWSEKGKVYIWRRRDRAALGRQVRPSGEAHGHAGPRYGRQRGRLEPRRWGLAADRGRRRVLQVLGRALPE